MVMIMDTISILALDRIGIPVPKWERVVSKRQLQVEGKLVVGVLEDLEDNIFRELWSVEDSKKEDLYDYIKSTYGSSSIVIVYPDIVISKIGSMQVTNKYEVILPDDDDFINTLLIDYADKIRDTIVLDDIGITFKWCISKDNKLIFLPNQEAKVYD